MKSNHHPIQGLASRLAASLLIALLLTSSVSCGGNESFCKNSVTAIGHQIDDLKALIVGDQTYADKAALWQSVAAVFIVLTIIAFVAGAGLGSRARKAQIEPTTETSTNPDIPTDEVAI